MSDSNNTYKTLEDSVLIEMATGSNFVDNETAYDDMLIDKLALEFLNEDTQKEITDFLLEVSAFLDRAKRFHQKISFSRHLDLARKKEAAWRMMRSAVQLIDKLALASVWVPSSIQNPKSQIQELSDRVEILAAFSKVEEDSIIYNNREQINIHKKNLINRIVVFDKSKG